MITYRKATPADAQAIANLHALSWQRHYKGLVDAYYLEHLCLKERTEIWQNRFEEMPENRSIILAEEEEKLCGFVCTFLNKGDEHGAFLDNLHVLSEWQGKGIGKTLMHKTTQWILERAGNIPMYLWVLPDNQQAIYFYKKMGGVAQDTKMWELEGYCKAPVVRFVWENLARFQKS